MTRAQKIITLASQEQYIGRGLTVGVFLTQGSPRILVNLRAAKAERVDFDSAIGRVARVVRR